MTKSFYFVVPFSVMETKGTMEVLGARKAFRLREEDLQRCRSQLLQRVEFLVQGLRRCGVHSVMLGDLELTELFWAMYNPKLAETGQVPIIG